MGEKILTLHPDLSKAGVNIRKDEYGFIRNVLLKILKTNGEVLFKDLPGKVEKTLKGKFAGSISWYVTTVKIGFRSKKNNRAHFRHIPSATTVD